MERTKDYGLDLERLPAHIAIIMDGNGRWAAARHLPREIGHKKGADVLDRVSEFANGLGIKHMTVYAFSTENWKRSEREVSSIMNLLRFYLDDYIRKKGKQDMKIDAIGDVSRLAPELQERIRALEDITRDKKGMRLHIAFNYGGRDEILRAVKKACEDAAQGNLSEMTEEIFRGYLDTRDIPDPDLLIRTGGEERISNFLLWQMAYSEFDFTAKLWPDYGDSDLVEAIKKYQSRERRFGGR